MGVSVGELDEFDVLKLVGVEVDLDLAPEPDSVMSQKQALSVSSDRDERLYLRARLSLARLTLA